MPLPKINYETHEFEIPVLNKTVRVRPITGHEEKILLKAKESELRSEHVKAMRQVVEKCLVDERADDVREWSMFALEYVFVKLRALSISDVITQTYRDNEDGKTYTFQIKIDDLSVREPEADVERTLSLPSDVTIELRWPTVSLYESEDFYSSPDSEVLTQVFSHCVERVYQGDEVFDLGKCSKKEVDEFVDSLPLDAIDRLQRFFMSAPSLHYEMEYTNEKGTERKITLSTVDDFFTLA